MISDRNRKVDRIVDRIRAGISEINVRYRSGPDLYFCRWVLALRSQAEDVSSFLQRDYSLEILYETLVTWDMNSRAAKMKYFDALRGSLCGAFGELMVLEEMLEMGILRSEEVLDTLRRT